MSENSKIEWTDHTFNTHWGCSKVSPGCDGCYAERLAARFGYGWGDDAPKREFDEKHWEELLRWDRKAQAEGVRRRVFTNSMSDLFDKFAPGGVRERHFGYVERTPHLDHLLLTKRIGNVARMVPQRWLEPGGWPANAWLGATICNQEEADRDIPKLLAVPARVRFLSMEPLLGPVRLPSFIDQRRSKGLDVWNLGVDWVIVGGESGPGARPMHPDWARSLRDQCAGGAVPFLFKQWGEWAPGNGGPGGDLYERDRTRIESGMFTYDGAWTPGGPNPFRQTMDRIGKKAAGRLLDGREWNGVPS